MSKFKYLLSDDAKEITKALLKDGMDFKQAVLSGIMLSGKKVTDDVVKILDRDAKFTKPTLMNEEAMNKFAQGDWDYYDGSDFQDIVPIVDNSYSNIAEVQIDKIPIEFENLKPIIQQISENRIPTNQLPLPGFIQKDPFDFYDMPENPKQFAEALVNKYGPNPTRANFRREIMKDNVLFNDDGDFLIQSNAAYDRAKEARKYALQQLGMLDA